MIGGHGPVFAEIGAAGAVGVDQPGPARRVFLGQCAEIGDAFGKARLVRIGDVVRPVGGADTPDQPLGLELLMVGQGIEREFCGHQHFDIGLVENGERQKLRCLQRRIDRVVDLVSGVRTERFVDAEHEVQRMVDPGLGGRGVEQIIVLGEQPPGVAALGDRLAVLARHAELVVAHALRPEHAQNVMVRRQEQRRRIGERRIVRQPLRHDMAMRADDRQAGDGGVEFARNGQLRLVCRQQAIGVQVHRFSRFLAHAREGGVPLPGWVMRPIVSGM